MLYETSEGKEIKSIKIDVSHLQETFDDYAKGFPFECLSLLNFLEYAIVHGAQIVELEEE